MKQLVILAGGRGSRLAAELGDIPKPMALVGGKPVLEHQLALARRDGFRDVHLLTHHRAERIEAFFGDGHAFGVDIHYHVERQPLGTAGAVLDALPELGERFVVLYGDTLLDVDLERFWRRHLEVGADASLFVHPNDHPFDSDLVEVDEDGWIRAFHPHPHAAGAYLGNLVNAALYLLERRALEAWAPPAAKLDFAHDLFPRMLSEGRRLYGYRSREYIKDMGTPERLARVERDLASGLVGRLSLRNACPAVFLDRDGTLNVEVDRVSQVDQLVLLPEAGAAVRRLNESGQLAVVVTNQPVVARGDCTEAELEAIHNKLETLLGAEGAYLDGLYACPHHPDRGFPGERSELKIACECRKPGIAMIERASHELGICLERSWLVGDTTTDLQTAQNAGLRSVLVRTGHAGRDGRWPVHPDYEFFDLSEAVEFICNGYSGLLDQARAALPACVPGSLIAIGGLSRSGKSTWAAVLRDVLAERGQHAIVVPLDAWLRSASERKPGLVSHRFDLAGITEVIGKLVQRKAAVELRLAHYDRLTRQRESASEAVPVAPDDVLLFEGVPALMIDTLVEAASHAYYVACPEALRRERFEAEYRWRGLSPTEIEALYRERELDEHPHVKRSAKIADTTVQGGS